MQSVVRSMRECVKQATFPTRFRLATHELAHQIFVSILLSPFSPHPLSQLTTASALAAPPAQISDFKLCWLGALSRVHQNSDMSSCHDGQSMERGRDIALETAKIKKR